MKKKLNNKKGEISIQTIFFILMAIIFVTILIFGFQKMFEVEKNLSEQERIEIKKYMKDSFEYCEDPLNSGNFKTFEIKNNLINVICILGEDAETKYVNYPDFLQLYSTKQKVIMLDTSFKIENGEHIFTNYFIVDSIKLDTDMPESKCYIKNEDKNLIEVKIECN